MNELKLANGGAKETKVLQVSADADMDEINAAVTEALFRVIASMRAEKNQFEQGRIF